MSYNKRGQLIQHDDTAGTRTITGFGVGSKFANGDMRKITNTTSNTNRYLNIFVEGPLLNPEQVGLPSQYSVAAAIST